MIRLRRADAVRIGDVVRLPDEREVRVAGVESEPGVVTLRLEDGNTLLCGQDQMVRLRNVGRL